MHSMDAYALYARHRVTQPKPANRWRRGRAHLGSSTPSLAGPRPTPAPGPLARTSVMRLIAKTHSGELPWAEWCYADTATVGQQAAWLAASSRPLARIKPPCSFRLAHRRWLTRPYGRSRTVPA